MPAGVTPKQWAAIRQVVLTRDKGRCQSCKTATATEVDHVWPQSKGGTNDLENLQAACGQCNRRKNATPPDGLLPLYSDPTPAPSLPPYTPPAPAPGDETIEEFVAR